MSCSLGVFARVCVSVCVGERRSASVRPRQLFRSHLGSERRFPLPRLAPFKIMPNNTDPKLTNKRTQYKNNRNNRANHEANARGIKTCSKLKEAPLQRPTPATARSQRQPNRASERQRQKWEKEKKSVSTIYCFVVFWDK